MAPSVKAVAERLLLRGGIAAISRRRYRARSLVLAYHNVVPDGRPRQGDVSLHITGQRFANHLDVLLGSGTEVVPLEEAPDFAEDGIGRDPARRVAITFDDAYVGAVNLGVAELVRRGLPATIFVVPGLLDGQTFWWDALSAAEGGLPPAVRIEALDRARGRNDEVFAWARRQGLTVSAVPEYMRSASVTETLEAAGKPGIELASHTWGHANLTRLSDEECRLEVDRAADWFRDQTGQEPAWLSYPYGLHDNVAERAAATAGHRGAFRIEGGWLPSSVADPVRFRLPRLNVPAGLSPDGLALRLAGLFAD